MRSNACMTFFTIEASYSNREMLTCCESSLAVPGKGSSRLQLDMLLLVGADSMARYVTKFVTTDLIAFAHEYEV